jgi:hypothetical protein
MEKNTTGEPTPPDNRFSFGELSPDDPIYRRGFAIGGMSSMRFSNSSPATASDTSKPSPTSPQDNADSTDHLPPDEGQLSTHRQFEQALSELLTNADLESEEPPAPPETSSPRDPGPA